MITKQSITAFLLSEQKSMKQASRHHPVTRPGQVVRPLPGMTDGMDMRPSRTSVKKLPANVRRQWSF